MADRELLAIMERAMGPRNAALHLDPEPDESGAFHVQQAPIGGGRWLHLRTEAEPVAVAIARVRGVAEASTHGRYQVYVVVGAAFTWEETLPGIREVILTANAGLILNEVPPPPSRTQGEA